VFPLPTHKNTQLNNQTNAGFTQLAEWSKRIEKLKEEISAKEERWLELMEMAESV
jgi:hypothetical protein